MVYERCLYSQLEKYLHHKNALVINGARQVGKTTLMKLLFEKIPKEQRLWFDFENPLDYKVFEETDYNDIPQKLFRLGLHPDKRTYIFIDEIQNFPEITKIIKYLIDHYQIKFVVTGSSSYYMRNLFPESLSGRKFVFTLTPLTFQEFLLFKGFVQTLSATTDLDLESKSLVAYEQHDEAFKEYMLFGGFPAVVLAKTVEEKKLTLQNIFKSYFEKDVINFGRFSEVREVRDLILLLTVRVGSKLDISKLAAHLGVSRKHIYSYLDFLQSTFFINLVSPYSKSVDRRLAGGKKVYFIDTGLLNEIAQVTEGQLLENAVFNQLSSYKKASTGDINYYQTQKGNEIDFVLNKDIAFEVKKKAVKKDLVNLNVLADKLKINQRYVVSEEFVESISSVVYPQFL